MLRNNLLRLLPHSTYGDMFRLSRHFHLTKFNFTAKAPAKEEKKPEKKDEKKPEQKPEEKKGEKKDEKKGEKKGEKKDEKKVEKKDEKKAEKKDDKGGGKAPAKPPPPPPPPAPVMKTIRVYRFKPGMKPFLQSFTVDVNLCGPMLQSVLTYIKARQDRTLTFRKSCREGKCGTCGVNVNGINTLACICPLNGPTITVYPLPHMYVIRDLVTDFSRFYEQYRSIEPWLQRRNEMTEGKGIAQYLQHEDDSNKMNGLYQCILCGCCQASCPSYWYGSKKYLGPAILLQAYRWLIDSRDDSHEMRLDALRDRDKVFLCATIMNCTKTCPINLNPGLAISKIKLLLAKWAKKEAPKIETLGLNKANKTL